MNVRAVFENVFGVQMKTESDFLKEIVRIATIVEDARIYGTMDSHDIQAYEDYLATLRENLSKTKAENITP